MKMKTKLLVATALLSTSFTPISMMTSAQAAVPTTVDMQNVCNSYDVDGAGTEYQVILTTGSVDNGAPTADESTVRDDESTRHGDPSSAQSPAGTRSFYSNAGRHGGSVNLFATVGWTAKLYAGSLVNQLVDRYETDTYNFNCQVQHWEVVGSHEEDVPAVPAQGYYTNNGTNPSGQEGSCQGIPNTNPHWGEDIGNCIWHETAPGTGPTTRTVDDYGWVNTDSHDESLTNGPYYVDTVTYATDVPEAVSYTETTNAPYFQGDVVVCNNPGKKGGTWTAQNGWTNMTQCTTTYFNTAPYISGANVFASNSLPL
jgi:hypothetical protein